VAARENCRGADGFLIARLCGYQGGQKYMSQSFNACFVEIVFGKIQLESAAKILDSPFELFPAQRRN
jgi:hypothetical protein